MDLEQQIKEQVHRCYWDHDHNCAYTILTTAAELCSVELEPQLLDAAVGMHGAGGYQAQCGLVEGGLMFIGVLGAGRGMKRSAIIETCREFTESYENTFGSLLCKELRPQGFAPNNPPHLCENLTVQSILFLLHILNDKMDLKV